MDEGGFFADPDDFVEAPTFVAPPSRSRAPPTSLAGQNPSRQPQADELDEEGEAALDEMEREALGLPCAATSSSQSAPQLGVCTDCRDAHGQANFFEAFRLNVCYDCQRWVAFLGAHLVAPAHCLLTAVGGGAVRRVAKGPGGKYQVITKSKAKDEYLLTDRQLNREYGGLGCIVQPNPHDRRYGDMKLYLRSQAEELALQTWGTDEALFSEKERRTEERLQKAEARKRKAAGTLGSGSAAAKGKRLAASAPSTFERAVAHRHEFLPDETYDVETDLWTKRCACGLEVAYERM